MLIMRRTTLNTELKTQNYKRNGSVEKFYKRIY